VTRPDRARARPQFSVVRRYQEGGLDAQERDLLVGLVGTLVARAYCANAANDSGDLELANRGPGLERAR
jgi:hypothetical protein